MARARLEATIGLNTGAFRRGIMSVKNMARGFNQYVIGPLKAVLGTLIKFGAIAGGLLATGLAIAIKQTADFGDKLSKMSQRTGLSTSELQKLGYAAELSGTNLDDLEKSVKRMSKVLSDASRGLSSANDSLVELGLSVESFQGLNADQAFEKAMLAIAEIEDPLRRAALAQEMFGRAGTSLLPMLSAGAKGLAEMKAQAERMGIIMGEDQIQNAVRFKDEMTRVSTLFKALGRGLVVDLLPVLSNALIRLQTVIREMKESGKLELFAEKLKQGAAVLLAAVDLFMNVPNKLQFLSALIITAFKIGALEVKKAIMEMTLLGRISKGARAAGAMSGLSRKDFDSEADYVAAAKAAMNESGDEQQGINKAKAQMEKLWDDLAKSSGFDSFSDRVNNLLKSLSAIGAAPPAIGAAAPDADIESSKQFDSLRRIGANLISGAAPASIEKEQLTQLQKIQKEIRESNKLLKEKINRKAVF